MREAFVILNPAARGGRGGDLERELQRLLPGAAIHPTQRPAHSRLLARQAVRAGYSLVVAAGGDGTLNEVLNGLGPFLGEIRLGLLPVGTGNDFARAAGIPVDLEAAVECLRAGLVRRCDVVSFRDRRLRRLFLNVSAAGFSGEVGETMTPELKESWGPLAYLRAALDTLPERSEYRLALTFDGRDTVHASALNLVVANGRFVAGGLPIAPAALLDDGRFDVVVLRSLTLGGMAALAPRVALGRHLDDPGERVLFRQARRLEVRAYPPLPMNVDGELLGPRSGSFEVLPGALAMVVGADAVALSPQPVERAGDELLPTLGAAAGGSGITVASGGGSRLPGWR